MSDDCSDHVEQQIKASMLDYQQDPRLAKSCKQEVSGSHAEVVTPLYI